MTRLNISKESQYIFGDCNKFHFMPNLSVSYSCLLTMLVGILCNVSPICQSLRSAPSRERDNGERDSMDSTGNGGSRSKVLRNLHVVRNQVPHLLRCVKKLYDCIAREISVLKDAPNKKGEICSPFCGSFFCRKTVGLGEPSSTVLAKYPRFFLIGGI